ncbi:hypothetical protein E3P99_01106 [Wallemia hederae]|uniref:C2H2-type domain-containing protein n=1 Tax=Wallemia hederae TaxID=1540922 RepID=A0A4T0FUL4_9BASI|nr:hypothetical protein E3P99_01106 [Wallemia hederae]
MASAVASTSATTPIKRSMEVLDDDNISQVLSRSPSPDHHYDRYAQTNQVDIHGNADYGPVTTCDWDDCGIVFGDQHLMLDHIYTDHIGDKSRYTCEWSSCSRKGKNQSTKQALIAHLRSHTTDKPFVCLEKAECDRSFTRADALAKHMRMQHHVDTLPTVRGTGAAVPPGEKKSKKAKVDQDDGGEDGGDGDQPQQQQQQDENESIYLDQADERAFAYIATAPGEPLYYSHYTMAATQHHIIEENNKYIQQVLDDEQKVLEQLDAENDRLLAEIIASEVSDKASDDMFQELTLPKLNRSLKSTNNHYRSGPHVIYHEIQTPDID